MKKILIFSTAYYPFVGGAEVAVKEITDRLPDFGCDMLTARMDRKLPKFEKIGNINVYRAGLGIGAADKFLLPFFGFLKALKLESENRYNIAWSIMASQASIVATFFKIFKPKAKLLLTLQEGDDEEHLKRYAFGNNLLYKIFIRPWHSLVFKKADLITAISNDLKKRALENGVKCEVEVVPNGVDIKQFSIFNFQFSKNDLNFNESDKILITTSRLVKKNAIEDVIEALQYLPENVKFLVLGIGPLEIDLKFKIKNLKLDGRVIFLGHVNHEDLPKYLKISDVFVRPSLSEGLGNSFLEAMAAGVPVVATPVGGIPDFLIDRKTGWFCEVKNSASIAEKIKYILDEKNKEEVNRVAANGKKMVEEKYNWDNIAVNMSDILNKLINLN